MPRVTQTNRTEPMSTVGFRQFTARPLLPKNGDGTASTNESSPSSNRSVNSKPPRFVTFCAATETVTLPPCVATCVIGDTQT